MRIFAIQNTRDGSVESHHCAVVGVISDLPVAVLLQLLGSVLSSASDTVGYSSVQFGLNGPVLAWSCCYLHGRSHKVCRGVHRAEVTVRARSSMDFKPKNCYPVRVDCLKQNKG